MRDLRSAGWRARDATVVLALLGALLAAWGGPAAAQTVSGRIGEQESAAPLPAAVVALIDTAGRQRAAVLSDSLGGFVLRAPGPGRYRVRAEHIGRETVTSAELALGPGAQISLRLEAPIAAILLRPIAVEVRSRCELHAVSAETTRRLWEEARKAFRVSTLARRTAPFVLRLFERDLDPANYRVRSETRGQKAGFGGRPFGADMSEAQLDSLGYVHKVFGDELMEQWEFTAPDEEVLVSNGFIEHHCLKLLDGGRQQRGLIGVGFEPIRPQGRDIKGTVWLDARSAELRSVEFRFTNLPWRVPEEAQGGRVDFQRLGSGLLVARFWYVRMPVVRTEQAAPGTVLTSERLVRVIESGGELEQARPPTRQ